jgi:ABC-type multidrug transport system fused ATPase/permease subunit
LIQDSDHLQEDGEVQQVPQDNAWAEGLTLENASFAFARRPSKLVLKNISLHLRPGEATALVGHSGSGKSTLAMILARVLSPTSGRVCLRGHDLRDIDKGWYRSRVAVVPQVRLQQHAGCCSMGACTFC